METLLPIFLIIPFAGFLISILFPENKEKAIFLSMAGAAGVQLLFGLVFIIYWAVLGGEPLNMKELTIYQTDNYHFFIDLFFDEVTATYLFMSSTLTFLIAHFSKSYMHKDFGFKRYFNTMLLYFFGIQVIIFSGNFETLFIGWEILGVSSFLLIAYYRDRYLPVRNGFKVFAIYRIADIAMLLAMWLLHHLFHENITFMELKEAHFVTDHIQNHYWAAFLIAVFIIIAASVKSAQFPFSAWLPRAMEGPTPSSSIFYGSIAVHIGIYLLLRTYPFWSEILAIKIGLIVLGIVSSFVASAVAKVQFSIKAQIAYSSIAQIGFMLVELALGWEIIVLIHLTGNAFLRSYQLLISPSIVTYMLRDQFFNFLPKMPKKIEGLKLKIRNTLYVLSLKEFYLDNYLYQYLWFPFKRLGHRVAFINTRVNFIMTTVIFCIALFIMNTNLEQYAVLKSYLPNTFALIGLVYVLRAFTIRKHPFKAWILLVLNHFWLAFAVSFNEHFSSIELFYYLSGVVIAGIIGIVILHLLSKTEKFNLDDYYGHAIEHRWYGFIFLLSALALMGFPISTTFLGEDLLLSHIHVNQVFLMGIVSVNLTIASISVMRVYARIFLGPNHKWYRSEARRSS